MQECEREDINDMKCIWKVLFPKKDQKGRIDESIPRMMATGVGIYLLSK